MTGTPPAAREHHLTVARTARYVTLGPLGRTARQIWFVCHGYGQLAARFIRRFEPLAARAEGCLIVAPEALSRFYLAPHDQEHGPESRVGASWMTREDRVAEIDDYVRYLDAVRADIVARAGAAAARVVGLGFSQGVATVCRWAARGAAPLDDVILWAGFLPPELEDDAVEPLRRATVTLVVGDQDPSASRVEGEVRRMARLNVPARIVRFSGGHELDAATLHALAAETSA